ncbi:MAG: cytochrome c [Proteobacteria bacterium]|nr:cytochrome c [Pseudomonadota bacterium]
MSRLFALAMLAALVAAGEPMHAAEPVRSLSAAEPAAPARAPVPAGSTRAAEPTISWSWQSVAPGTDPGKAGFERACAVCHGEGPDRPGTSSLQIKYADKLPALLEQRTDLTPEFVRYYIRNGFAMMPRFRKSELSDAEVEAIARYLSRKR